MNPWTTSPFTAVAGYGKGRPVSYEDTSVTWKDPGPLCLADSCNHVCAESVRVETGAAATAVAPRLSELTPVPYGQLSPSLGVSLLVPDLSRKSVRQHAAVMLNTQVINLASHDARTALTHPTERLTPRSLAAVDVSGVSSGDGRRSGQQVPQLVFQPAPQTVWKSIPSAPQVPTSRITTASDPRPLRRTVFSKRPSARVFEPLLHTERSKLGWQSCVWDSDGVKPAPVRPVLPVLVPKLQLEIDDLPAVPVYPRVRSLSSSRHTLGCLVRPSVNVAVSSMTARHTAAELIVNARKAKASAHPGYIKPPAYTENHLLSTGRPLGSRSRTTSTQCACVTCGDP